MLAQRLRRDSRRVAVTECLVELEDFSDRTGPDNWIKVCLCILEILGNVAALSKAQAGCLEPFQAP